MRTIHSSFEKGLRVYDQHGNLGLLIGHTEQPPTITVVWTDNSKTIHSVGPDARFNANMAEWNVSRIEG